MKDIHEIIKSLEYDTLTFQGVKNLILTSYIISWQVDGIMEVIIFIIDFQLFSWQVDRSNFFYDILFVICWQVDAYGSNYIYDMLFF